MHKKKNYYKSIKHRNNLIQIVELSTPIISEKMIKAFTAIIFIEWQKLIFVKLYPESDDVFCTVTPIVLVHCELLVA